MEVNIYGYTKRKTDLQIVVEMYLELRRVPKEWWNKMFPRHVKAATELLIQNAYNVSTACNMLYEFNSIAKDRDMEWTIETLNRWLIDKKFQ